MKTKRLFYCASCLAILLAALAACSTDDVKGSGGGDEHDLYAVRDRAFGEYLLYNCSRTDANALPYGTAVERDGVIYIDTDIAASAENLYLVKTESQISKLQSAGLATAAVKITDLDGLQYFTSLKELRITSNLVSSLDLSDLAQLETVEMNFNVVPTLDLSHNPRLVRFRYGGNTDGEASAKLSAISFAENGAIQHIYLRNQDIAAGGFTLPADPASLTELDLSGNPGAPFEIPAELFARLTTAQGVVAAATPGPDPSENQYELTDRAFAEYLMYNSTDAAADRLPEGIVVEQSGKYLLDKNLAATVTVLNVAKTSSAISRLEAAGVATASTYIASADGLQFFTSLTEFTATSNRFTEPLPLTGLKDLEVLQVNTAYVSSLDLSGNPKLRTLNCNGSTRSGATKLSVIDLSHNTLLETVNLNNNALTSIDVAGLVSLRTLNLSGNPGAPFKIPAAIFAGLTASSGVEAE